MNFTFVLTSRYPTEKAYGVTTSGSIEALQKLGYCVQVISGSSMLQKQNYFKFHFFRNFAKKNSMLDQLSFKIRQLRFAFILVKNRNVQCSSVIWTRETALAFLLRIFAPRTQIVLELHQIPRKIDRLMLRSMKNASRVVLGTIRESIAYEIGLELGKFLVLPMAVNEAFIKAGESASFPKNGNSIENITYIGRQHNAHEELDIEYLLINLIKMLEKFNNLTINIVGISQSALLKIVEPEKLQRVKIFSNASRSEVLSILRESDIGIVIYPDKRYYRSVFPIKIVEYASTRTHIVASNTTSNIEILKSDKATFFALEEKYGLQKSLEYVLKHLKEVEKRTERAFEWSQEFTFEKRVIKVIQELKYRNRE